MAHPLDSIIRQVEANDPHGPDEKRVMLDASNRVVAPGFMAALRVRRNYLVHPQRTATRSGLTVPLRTLGGELTLQVAYLVRCDKQGEDRLAMAIAAAPSAQLALDDFISQRLELFVQALGIDELARDFVSHCKVFRNQLAAELSKHFGLLLIDAKITPGEHTLDARRVGPIVLQVRPHDSSLTLDVEFEAVLNVDAAHHVRAHAKESELEALIQTLISHAREFLNLRVALHELFVELGGSVRERFASSVSELVTQHGRELSAVTFRCRFDRHQVLAHVPRSLEHHVAFEHKNPSYPNAIHITASLNMKLTNVALLVNAGVTSLTEWLDATVKQVSADLLFKLNHEEFCQSLVNRKQELETRMKAAALKIGYEVDHFYSMTDHQIDELVRGVELGPIQDHFVLKSSKQLKVELKVFVKARVPTERLGDLMKRIVKNEDLKREMIGLAWNSTAAFMRKLTPEEFYLYFEVARPENELSQAQLLLKKIRAELFEVYGAEVMDFDVTPLESAVTSLFDRLRRADGELTLNVQPAHHPPVQFDLGFRVHGVMSDRWHTFQATMPEAADVALAIKKQLDSELANLGGAILINESKQVGELADLRVQAGMRELFGLNVKVIRCRRLAADWEIRAGEELGNRYKDDVREAGEVRMAYRAQRDALRAAGNRRLAASLTKEEEYRAQAAEQRQIGNIDEARLLEQSAEQEAKERAKIVEVARAADDVQRKQTEALGYAPHALMPIGSQLDAKQLLAQSMSEARLELGQGLPAEEDHAEES